MQEAAKTERAIAAIAALAERLDMLRPQISAGRSGGS